MKRFAAIVCLFPVLCHGADIGLLPEQKKPLNVSGKDRNPFGTHLVAPVTVQEDTESEEARIRKVIGKLPISGIVLGSSNFKVLLGSMIIEAGKRMPPVIESQTEVLIVLSAAPRRVELGFIEKDGAAHLRKITLSPDLTPEVHYMLESQTGSTAAEQSAAKSSLGGVTGKHDTQSPTQ